MENHILQWDKWFPLGGFFLQANVEVIFHCNTGCKAPKVGKMPLVSLVLFVKVMWKEAHCFLKQSKLLKIKKHTKHKTQANTHTHPTCFPYLFLCFLSLLSECFGVFQSCGLSPRTLVSAGKRGSTATAPEMGDRSQAKGHLWESSMWRHRFTTGDGKWW